MEGSPNNIVWPSWLHLPFTLGPIGSIQPFEAQHGEWGPPIAKVTDMDWEIWTIWLILSDVMLSVAWHFFAVDMMLQIRVRWLSPTSRFSAGYLFGTARLGVVLYFFRAKPTALYIYLHGFSFVLHTLIGITALIFNDGPWKSLRPNASGVFHQQHPFNPYVFFPACKRYIQNLVDHVQWGILQWLVYSVSRAKNSWFGQLPWAQFRLMHGAAMLNKVEAKLPQQVTEKLNAIRQSYNRLEELGRKMERKKQRRRRTRAVSGNSSGSAESSSSDDLSYSEFDSIVDCMSPLVCNGKERSHSSSISTDDSSGGEDDTFSPPTQLMGIRRRRVGNQTTKNVELLNCNSKPRAATSLGNQTTKNVELSNSNNKPRTASSLESKTPIDACEAISRSVDSSSNESIEDYIAQGKDSDDGTADEHMNGFFIGDDDISDDILEPDDIEEFGYDYDEMFEDEQGFESYDSPRPVMGRTNVFADNVPCVETSSEQSELIEVYGTDDVWVENNEGPLSDGPITLHGPGDFKLSVPPDKWNESLLFWARPALEHHLSRSKDDSPRSGHSIPEPETEADATTSTSSHGSSSCCEGGISRGTIVIRGDGLLLSIRPIQPRLRTVVLHSIHSKEEPVPSREVIVELIGKRVKCKSGSKTLYMYAEFSEYGMALTSAQRTTVRWVLNTLNGVKDDTLPLGAYRCPNHVKELEQIGANLSDNSRSKYFGMRKVKIRIGASGGKKYKSNRRKRGKGDPRRKLMEDTSFF